MRISNEAREPAAVPTGPFPRVDAVLAARRASDDVAPPAAPAAPAAGMPEPDDNPTEVVDLR